MGSDLAEVLSAGGQGVIIVIVILAIVALLRNSIRAVKEYDRLVIFFIGRFSGVRGPGLTYVLPFVESAHKVDMREKIIDIPRRPPSPKTMPPLASTSWSTIASPIRNRP